MSGIVMGGDPRLMPRVRDIINGWPKGHGCDVADVVEELRQRHPEYARKKLNAFTKLVEGCLEILNPSPPIVVTAPASATKKRKQNSTSRKDVVQLSDDEESEANGTAVDDQYKRGSNSMNRSLVSVYQKNGPPTSSNSAKSPVDVKRSRRSAASLALPSSSGSASSSSTFVVQPTRSGITFADLGGCERQFLEAVRLAMHLKRPETFSALGVPAPRGFLVHGPPGCGKTSFAQAVAGQLDLPLILVAATELVSGVSGGSEEKIRQLFEQARKAAPCVLVLDEIDCIAGRRESAQREMERRIVSQLLSCLDELSQPPKLTANDALEFDANGEPQAKTTPKMKAEANVLVIGTTSRPEAIDAALRRAGRFDAEIGLGIPDERARTAILERVCSVPLADGLTLQQLARLTPGYVGADLKALVREAAKAAVNRLFDTLVQKTADSRQLTDQQVTEELRRILEWLECEDDPSQLQLTDFRVSAPDFERALENVQPSTLREGFATVPDVSWSDIGALSRVRQQLNWSILYPVQRPEDFAALGIGARPQGILFCGPPGCGKTLLAKAVANETGMNFISVKGPELLNMYVGESERAVRTVFQRARDSAPCVVFFDEIDALAPRRGGMTETAGSARLVNQLLTEMDGLEARKQVYLLGATNRPDMVDAAVLRPGRLDKIIFIDFPSPDDREDILRKSTKNGTRPRLAPHLELSQLARDERLDGFTGADLAALAHEAGVLALQERLQDQGKVPLEWVEQRHFDAALNRVRPSVSQADRQRYEAMRAKFGTALS